MPDCHQGVFEFNTQKELSAFIRNQLSHLDMPARLFADVRIRKLWSFIQQYGSSCAHFRIEHNGYELAFHGLTDQEFIDGLGD